MHGCCGVQAAGGLVLWVGQEGHHNTVLGQLANCVLDVFLAVDNTQLLVAKPSSSPPPCGAAGTRPSPAAAPRGRSAVPPRCWCACAHRRSHPCGRSRLQHQEVPHTAAEICCVLACKRANVSLPAGPLHLLPALPAKSTLGTPVCTAPQPPPSPPLTNDGVLAGVQAQRRGHHLHPPHLVLMRHVARQAQHGGVVQPAAGEGGAEDCGGAEDVVVGVKPPTWR